MSKDRTAIRLLVGHPYPCPYLPGETARNVYADPGFKLDPEGQRLLTDAGMRRSGSLMYRPHCSACRACRSLRIPVDRFQPNRSQRRCWARNSDLSCIPGPLRLDDEHRQLYRRYLEVRHPDSPMTGDEPGSVDEFLGAPWAETWMLELRLGNALLATAITDRLIDGLSAVYTFYEPDLPRRGLGTYAILAQIELARMNGLTHLYLGYWVRNATTMAYKSRYAGCEILIGNRWQALA